MRQGCILSPGLFSLYSEVVMHALEDLEGISIGGRNLNNIRYADDAVLIADSEKKLQALMSKLMDECESKGLRINVDKTNTLTVTKSKEKVKIKVGETEVKQVESFVYLGSTITDQGNSEKEIVKRIGLAKKAFGNMDNMLKNLSMSIKVRIRILKCFVWSKLLYGCEAWTIRKDFRRKLDAVEMWFVRRMLRIQWTDKVTNEEVLKRAGLERGLMRSIEKRQLQVLGHILRAQGLESDCLLARINGKRAKGRQRKKFMDCLLESFSGPHIVAELVHLAQDRQKWRFMIANVT